MSTYQEEVDCVSFAEGERWVHGFLNRNKLPGQLRNTGWIRLEEKKTQPLQSENSAVPSSGSTLNIHFSLEHTELYFLISKMADSRLKIRYLNLTHTLTQVGNTNTIGLE